MSIERHAENRAWAFEALDELEAFLTDADFEGAPEEESALLGKKRVELRDNKYRVVILGAFNVGKSAMINALLGDEYLPTVLEECTTKITHVLKSDAMRVVLHLTQQPAQGELEALRELLTALGTPVDVTMPEDSRIVITFTEPEARGLVKSLRPLVTMSADEDFPQLRKLRGRYDEIHVCIPNDMLPEDVALVDSPGAHSISETNRKITEDIVPECHLVVCLIDSQSAGNESDREFIEAVARHRHRKIFFVINKSDQLNPDEIDLYGRRGPGRDLMRSLNNIVEAPELFFVSSLYALIGLQLHEGKLDIVALDNNNKIKIPLCMHEPLLGSANPREAIAEYLTGQSRFDEFKTRLLEYLYNENREGAVLESVCRFIDGRAWKYARPIEMKMEMARNMPRFKELEVERERLYAEIDASRAASIDALNAYAAMSGGGSVDGQDCAGYEAALDRLITRNALEERVVKPVCEWVSNDENLKTAKKSGYAPVAEVLESRLEAFLALSYGELDREVGRTEQAARGRMGKLSEQLPQSNCDEIGADCATAGSLKPSMAGSYFGFAMSGAIFGAAAGAATGYAVAAADPAVMGIAAGSGALAGFVAGLIVRAATAKRVIKKKLQTAVAECVDRIVFRGEGNVKPVVEQVRAKLRASRESMTEMIQGAFDCDVERLNAELDKVKREEDALRARQAEILARLEPKHERLIGIGKTAREISGNTSANQAH